MRQLRLIAAVASAFAAVILAASPAAAGQSSAWKLGYYTPSGRALSMASVQTGAGIASFDFTADDSTALLVTTRGSSAFRGDLTGRTITATFTISGATGDFTYFGEGTDQNPCVYPANTRLFFLTDNGGGFAFTHYWWSNPENQVLANGTFTLTATVEPAEWSDWNGQPGVTQTAGFADAAANVTMVGFSFGGGCFFENGVGTSDGTGTFTLQSFSVG